MFSPTAADSTSVQSVGAAPQTYIVAQNPLVLAHLLRENQSRALDPQAYITPASVFNTVAVDFAGKLPEDTNIVDKIINPKPDEKVDIPLQTVPIPAASLHKLDPIVPSTPEADETLTVVVGARESCDNLCQNTQTISPRTDVSSPSQGQSEPELPTEPYANRVRSLERNTRGTLSTAERAPVRMGSLERNARGSLSHRGSPIPIAPFTRQHSVPASPPPRSRRDQDVGQFSVQGALNAQLAASVVNKMRHQPDPPFVEEIYDFGGDNVKSCAAIAAIKAGLSKQSYRPGVSGMSISHPNSYGVPVGVVQGIPYSQSPGKSSHAMPKVASQFRPASPLSHVGYPQMSTAQAFNTPSQSQGFVTPSQQQSFATSQTQNFASPSQQNFGTPSQQQNFAIPSQQQNFATPSQQQNFTTQPQSFSPSSQSQGFVTPQQNFASAQPMGVIPPMSYVPQQIYSTHNVVQGAQPMLYRPQVSLSQAASSTAGFQGQARPQFVSASSMDAQSLYASRQECSPVVPAMVQSTASVVQSASNLPQPVQVI